MLFVRHRVGVFFHPDHAIHRIDHYWGMVAGSKAWEGRLWTKEQWASPRFGQNLRYTNRIEPSQNKTLDVSPCRKSLAALRRSAEAHPSARRVGRRFEPRPPSLHLW